MIFGDPQKERIQFNENTLYSGEPETPKDINVASDLGHIRQLLNEGKNTEAGNIIQQKWIGRLNEAYQPFGDLYIEFASKGAITDYIHSLDMNNSIVTTSYKQNGIAIRREVFASYPAQAIIIHLSLIHISEPTRLGMISYAVFCLKKKKTQDTKKKKKKKHKNTQQRKARCNRTGLVHF